MTRTAAKAGAVSFIQHFGSTLNLNVHLHILFLNGVYGTGDPDASLFRRVPAPTRAQLQAMLVRISQRVGRYLQRQGLLVRGPEQDYLQLDVLDEEAACSDHK